MSNIEQGMSSVDATLRWVQRSVFDMERGLSVNDIVTSKKEMADFTNHADESFRDRVSSIDQKGKRIWIYPKKPAGNFHRQRLWVSWVLIAILIGVPFLESNGRPFFLFNIVQRKFIIFGMAFWPQDFHLFALTVLAGIIFIVLFTAVFGRIWCGWACPQTVFMELVFRKMEYWIEGDAGQQRKLNERSLDIQKILKKTSKHAIFFAMSFIVGNILLAWIIGTKDLFLIVTAPPGEHWVGLSFMIAFSLLFYWIFAWFREQACVFVCPYGRLQSVLLDKNSIVVAYDFKRGEPRGKKSETETLGDCIDCKMCVHVCPTGIDIRNGTQMECVNCTACIDACDEVMRKIKRPEKLIRYGSVNLISESKKFTVTPRIVGYSGVLVMLTGIIAILLITRKDVEMTVVRARGSLYQMTAAGNISNIYMANIVNKTFDPMQVTLKIKDYDAQIKLAGVQELNIEPDGLIETTFLIEIPKSEITKSNTPLEIGIYWGDRLLENVSTTFIGPTAK